MSAGHPHARFYPLGWLSDEAHLVVARQRGIILLENDLLLSALGAAQGGKKSFAAWKKRFKELNVEAAPRKT